MNRKQKTVDLINNTQLSIHEIHQATGLDKRWLHKFKRGDFKSQDKVEVLYNYLRRRK